MGDSTREEQLFQDVGRLARHKRGRGEADDRGYRPLSETRQAAMLDRALDERSPPGRLKHVVGYLSTAAAAAALVAVVTNLSHENSETSDHAPLVKPPFDSWKIEGGGPPPLHQGTPTPSPELRICQGNTFGLTLAVTRDRRIDPTMPLELVLRATPDEGQAHRFVYDIGHDQRFTWSEDRGALSFDGTIETLAPLSVGSWTLEPSLGAPGACSPEGERGACTNLRSRAVDIVDAEHCDEAG